MNNILKSLKEIAKQNAMSICKETKLIDEKEFAKMIDKMNIGEITNLSLDLFNTYNVKCMNDNLKRSQTVDLKCIDKKLM